MWKQNINYLTQLLFNTSHIFSSLNLPTKCFPYCDSWSRYLNHIWSVITPLLIAGSTCWQLLNRRDKINYSKKQYKTFFDRVTKENTPKIIRLRNLSRRVGWDLASWSHDASSTHAFQKAQGWMGGGSINLCDIGYAIPIRTSNLSKSPNEVVGM